MKKLIQISLLIFVEFMVFSCLDVVDEYDFDGNDFEYDVSVGFSHVDFQPSGKDTISLYVVTDSLVGSSSLEIINEVEIEGNEIRIELIEIQLLSQIVHQDISQTRTNIDLILNGKDNLYKIVFFSGDSISTASLRYYKLLEKYVLKPLKETNVTINEDVLYVND